MSELKIDANGYSEYGVSVDGNENNNWAAEYAKRTVADHAKKEILDHPDGSVTFSKLSAELRAKISESKTDSEQALSISRDTQSTTSEQCHKALTDSGNAVTMAEAAQRDSAAAKEATAAAEAAAELAKEASETAAGNSQSAETNAQTALSVSSEAKAAAEAANQKVGDLGKIHDDYPKTDLVSYINDVAGNLGSVAIHFTEITDEHASAIAAKASTKYVDDKIAVVNAKIPTNVSALENDRNYVPRADMDDALATKQDKELQWTLLYEETVAEERGSTASDDYGLNLDYERKRLVSKGNPNPTICIFPEYKNIVGLRIAIVIPEDQSFGGYPLLTIGSNSSWAQAYTLSTLNADTPRTKIINADWKIEHGVSESKCLIRTGVNSGTTTRPYCMDNGGNVTNGFFPISYFKSIQYRHKFPVGAEIKVWGLIKE